MGLGVLSFLLLLFTALLRHSLSFYPFLLFSVIVPHPFHLLSLIFCCFPYSLFFLFLFIILRVLTPFTSLTFPSNIFPILYSLPYMPPFLLFFFLIPYFVTFIHLYYPSLSHSFINFIRFPPFLIDYTLSLLFPSFPSILPPYSPLYSVAAKRKNDTLFA